jgi:hypothetical protein
MTLTTCSVTAMILAMLAVPLATHAQPSGVRVEAGWQIFASTHHVGA